MYRLIYLIALVQTNLAIIPGNKPDYAVERKYRSIFSGKTQSQTITPAPYTANIKYDNSATNNFMPAHYFPDTEYPINIFEASKPLYAGTDENNAFLSSFPSDVVNNFNSVSKSTNSKSFNDYRKSRSILNVVSTTQSQFTKPTVNDDSTNKNKNVNNAMSVKLVQNSAMSDKDISQNEVEIIYDNMQDTETQLSKPKTVSLQNIAKSDKTIEPESNTNETYDVYYYEDGSSDNNTTLYNDEVDIFYSNEEFGNAGEEDDPTNASVAEDTVISKTNILHETTTRESSSLSSSDAEDIIEQNTSIVEPDASPLKISVLQQNSETKTSVPKKMPKKIGLGPIQKVKQRKLMKHLFRGNLKIQ